jgi:NAD-dependent deacetylase
MDNILHAAQLMLSAKYVVALTGAGISVESGIRPFRGPDGIWTEKGEPPMDGYQQFMRNPKRYWEETTKNGPGDFMKAIAEAVPHPAHFSLAEMEEMGILKYLITQNIDDPHNAAGSKKVAEIHGNTRKLRCLDCNARFELDDTAISYEVLPPRCPKCRGILKTDMVMFGEPIPYDVLQLCQRESECADCMLTVGTSAFVYPAAGFPLEVKQNGGRLIEVNLYETEMTPLCDISLRGRAGDILPELVECIRKLSGKK